MTERAAAQANAHDCAPGHAIARDPAGTGPRGENLRLAEDAGTAHMRFPLNLSGAGSEKLAAENIGSSKC